MAYTGSLPFRYDHEDITFAIELTGQDGSDFDFTTFALECAVGNDNGNVLTLARGAGISVEPTINIVTFKLGLLSADNYTVACDAVNRTTGDHTTLFAVSQHVAEGPF